MLQIQSSNVTFLGFYDYLFSFMVLFGFFMALLALFGTFGLLLCFVKNSLLSQFTHFFRENSGIRETPTVLTDADSRTDTNLKRLHDLSFFFNAVNKKLLGGPKFFF